MENQHLHGPLDVPCRTTAVESLRYLQADAEHILNLGAPLRFGQQKILVSMAMNPTHNPLRVYDNVVEEAA